MEDIKEGDFIKWRKSGGIEGEGLVWAIGSDHSGVVAVDVGYFGGKEWVYATDVYYKGKAPAETADDYEPTAFTSEPDDHAEEDDAEEDDIDCTYAYTDIKVGDFVKWNTPGGCMGGEGVVLSIVGDLSGKIAVSTGGVGKKWIYTTDIYYKKSAPAETVTQADGYHDKKADAGKARMDLLPWAALVEVGRVLAFGCIKYSEDSWRDVPDARKRYLAAMLRHVAAIQDGEATDPESGLSHAGHMACNALFVCWLTLKGK